MRAWEESCCINIITLGNYGNDVHPNEEQEVDINQNSLQAIIIRNLHSLQFHDQVDTQRLVLALFEGF